MQADGRKIRRRNTSVCMIAAALLLSAACGEDATGPIISLVGSWQLVGFSDAGVAAVTTGTWVFRADGSFDVIGTVEFPGEPADALALMGTYAQDENTVTLNVSGEITVWILTASGDEITLTEQAPPPANIITLRRV